MLKLDAVRADNGDAALHEPGTGSGSIARRAYRHLLAGRDLLPDVSRRAAFQGEDGLRAGHPSCEHAAAAPGGAAARCAGRIVRHGPQDDGERPRAPVSDMCRADSRRVPRSRAVRRTQEPGGSRFQPDDSPHGRRVDRHLSAGKRRGAGADPFLSFFGPAARPVLESALRNRPGGSGARDSRRQPCGVATLWRAQACGYPGEPPLGSGKTRKIP